MTDRRPAGPETDGGLERILETERRIEARLEECRGECRRIVEQAEREARLADEALERELVEETGRLRADAERRRHDELGAVAAAARSDVARFEDVSPERFERLVGHVVDRVLAARSPA